MTFGMSRQGAQLLVHADLGGLTQADLDAAYAAYRQKRKYVRLKNGTFLSEDALEQAAQISQVLDESRHDRRRSAERRRNAAGTGDVSGTGACGSQGRFAGYAQRWKRGWSVSSAAQNAGRAAQGASCGTAALSEDGAVVADALSDAGFGGILADDMGLGKTVQTLALLLREMERDIGGLRAGGLSGFAPAELARRGGEIRARPALRSADGDGGSLPKAD